MAVDPVEFASLLCSRLCHDLLSPVGALNNGVELLSDEQDPMMRDQVVELLGQSARSTAEKLKFFRLAFGAAGGFGDKVDVREAKAAIEGLFGINGRVQVNWLVSEHSLSKPAIKVLLNLAMIAGDALVRGGRLDVGAEIVGEKTEIVIRSEGDRLILDPELRAALTGQVDERALSSRTAAAHMAHSIAVSSGGSIQVSDADPAFILFGATLGGV
jgi:histidine phosphotransferase ChpT